MFNETTLLKLQDLINEDPKITVWCSGELGFGHARKGRIKEVEVKDYAQYQDILTIVLRPYRKRRDVRIWFTPYKRVIVWEGWHEVNTDIWTVGETDKRGATVQKSKFTAFSVGWVGQALTSVAQEPLFTLHTRRQIPPLKTVGLTG